MNIFKVLASGKKPMYEEQMSSILAWLLHPQMEHGLGHELLSRFISSISDECGKLTTTAENLRNRLRGEAVSDFGMELEENVTSAFIDILISIDDWKIAIENKIYSGSTMEGQLNKEYSGVITKYNDKSCVLVYLVPTDEFGELHRQVQREYNSFDKSKLRNGDFLKLITWQENNIGCPSIVSLVENLLSDESVGKTEPLSDYTRHTLKALIMFIRGGFSGYDYERINIQNEVYPKIKTADILTKTSGFIGVRFGIAGLIRQTSDEISNNTYQYNDTDNSTNYNWVAIEDFKQIYNWKANGVPPVISWNKTRLTAKDLYNIACACSANQPLYIGIRGGLRALENMENEKIKESAWQLSATDEPPNSQWISGERFIEVLEMKKVYE